MMQVPTWKTSVGDSGKFQPLSGRAANRTVDRMTSWGRHHIVVCLLAVAPVAACGGAIASDGAPRVAHGTPTTASARVARRAAPSPAPVTVDRGDDPLAIARSLLRWGRWLEAAHPDPALVDRAYAWGGKLERGVRAEVTALRRTRRRIVEVDAAPLDVVVVSRLPDVVSFRVTKHLDRRDLVDAQGRVLDHVGPTTERYIVLLQRFADDEPWRLVEVDTVEPIRATTEGSGELDGGRLGVGIETSTGGTVTFEAGSPALPRLVHYVWTPLPAGRPGSLENLCDAANGAITDPSEVVFGWLYRVVGYSRDGQMVSDTHECVPFPDPNDRSRPPPPPDLVVPTIGDVWRAVALPRPLVGANPVTRGVTGLDTWLWSGGPTTVQVAATIGAFRITGTARVVGYRFATDDGFLGETAASGDDENPAAIHRFARKGAHTLSVSTVWRATVTMTGPGGIAAVPVDLDTAVLTVTVDYPVVEVRTRLVA